jgi:hypothetical protein
VAFFGLASLTTLAACSGTGLPSGPSSALGATGTRAASTQVRAGGAVTPSVSNPYPFTQGDTFAYAYTLTHSAKPTGKPLNKSYTTGSIATTIGSTESFDGKQLTDVNEVFTYTNTDSGHHTTGSGTLTTDEYETFATGKNGAVDYETYGDTTSGNSSNSDGSTSATTSTLTYGNAFLLDVLPETPKTTFKEEIAYTLDSDDQTTKDGVTTNDQTSYQRNSDGSYTRSITRSAPSKSTFQENDQQNSDGSGQTQNNGSGPTAGTTTFSAPVESGGKYYITVVYTPPSGPATTTQVPDWFPGNGPARHLVTDEKKDLGSVSVPSKCGATAGQSAVELRESITALDVVQGWYNTETLDSYVVSGEGVVCIDHQRLLNTYDNLVTGDLMTAEHFNELTSLTSESQARLRNKHLTLGFASTLR